ncbi:alpha/beta hydrolase family protein [Labilithrix luteola]|uniref:alpha/beta hydrolase family protein n=1 Tax=Labilithrix luteola TaxID=1391654 RepID=UPI0023DDEF95|nr:alpha/beta fold hydrolase [Labilithrix luteola]
MPKSNEKHAAVVFIHGSGPLDRDESVGALKPFRDLAQGFASAGIVSLRYDKRAFAYKTTAPEVAFATFEASTIDDACAAIDAVRKEPSVDPAKVFVVGHSLGGYALPTVVARCKTPIAGLIALAPAGRALQDIIVAQREAQLVASEPPSAARDAKVADLRAQATKVRALPTTAANDPPASDLLGIPASYWRSLDHASFPKRVSAISVPTLATFGGNDVQVTSSDAAVWEALAQAHEPRETLDIRRYPSLNHFLFSGRMEASTPLTAHTADANLVGDLVDWIRARSRTSG